MKSNRTLPSAAEDEGHASWGLWPRFIRFYHLLFAFPIVQNSAMLSRQATILHQSADGTNLLHGKQTPTKRAVTAPVVVVCPDSPSSTTKLRDHESERTNTNTKKSAVAVAAAAAGGRPFRRSETFGTTGTGTGTTGKRPPLARVPSTPTRYMEMLLHLDEIPRMHNILASLGTWIILAGFLVVPGTFTTFKQSKAFQEADDNNGDEVAHAIVHSIANIGLLWFSGSFCVIGTAVCLWLWVWWRHNYVWLVNKIFMPVTLNSVAGLITTLVNVYTAQHGVWSVTAKITALVTGSCVGVAGGLFGIYNFGLLRRVQRLHERELGLDIHRHDEETLVEKVKRKAHEPSLQPGSMV
ncbi:hypothetical protein LTS15_000723 [Exophiala xenobiotica]|nr:hypothetical protein LTS15_000723 [Exophiala xenobiotica]